MENYIIYQKSRNIMQTMAGQNKVWVLQNKHDSREFSANITTGWTQAEKVASFIQLYFNSFEDAVAYATSNKLKYSIIEPNKVKVQKKNYKFNFTKDRNLYYY